MGSSINGGSVCASSGCSTKPRTRVGGNPVRDNLNLGPFAGSFYSLSADFNYRPHPNVLIRPEVCADWFDGRRSPDNDGLNKNQVLAAINAALQFLRDA